MSVPFRFAKSRPSSDWERERSEDWEGDPDNLLDRCLPLPLTLCLLLLLSQQPEVPERPNHGGGGRTRQSIVFPLARRGGPGPRPWA